jgi:hypothetical protein
MSSESKASCCLIGVLAALAMACGDSSSNPGIDGGDVDQDAAACPDERPESVSEFSSTCSTGLVCAYGSETCACDTSRGTVCSTCPFDEESGDLDMASCSVEGDTCTVADAEHDYACTCVSPEMDWICCSEQFTGVVCEGEGCGATAGTPCCAGQINADDPELTCVEGRWEEP